MSIIATSRAATSPSGIKSLMNRFLSEILAPVMWTISDFDCSRPEIEEKHLQALRFVRLTLLSLVGTELISV